MMNIRFTILSAMAFFALGEAQAQKAWSLRQCIDYALEHNITVKQMQNIREQQALQLNTNKNSSPTRPQCLGWREHLLRSWTDGTEYLRRPYHQFYFFLIGNNSLSLRWQQDDPQHTS